MSTQQKNSSDIAIVGMAGRFPKAKNIGEFWRNLCDGVEGVSFFSDKELEAAGIEFPKNDPSFVKARGVLDDADLFDAAFFGVNPREAAIMDPQHRVFLECAWEALESAGCDPAKFDGAIGVFAGVSMNTYLAHNLFSHPELIAQLNEHQLMLGNDKDFLPTRVSYKLNLRGPSLNIQTACSTSLVAVCVACQNLLNYECDAALAGAVSITFPQKRGYHFQEGGIASPDGHCRAFDAKAAGTVAGEGAGIVVLKRLEDAMTDGDTIYAVIKGFALNNDGANKIGYTAPSVDGQAEVIATAQAMAGFAPETIGYVEAHGTGTPLGDPVEIEGLAKAFRAGTSRKNFCAIGSVKSNVGHLDTAAGVTGLIKTALALHRKKIPPSLHFESSNPAIAFTDSPFFVNGKLTDWTNGAMPRRAGVSSFGIGGTNAHVVLEEAPALESSTDSRPSQLLLLSAKTEMALDQATTNLADHLKQNPTLNPADVAHTLQAGRHDFTHRRMLVCRDVKDAVTALEARDAKRIFSRVSQHENPPVVFMFPGQGAQQVNMARELYERETTFREQADLCCEILKPRLGFDLQTVLFPASAGVSPANCDSEKLTGETPALPGLTQTAVTQPALFVIEYALARLWMSWGVRPEAMIGHSVGEYVAACLAGVFSLEDALALIAARGSLMQQLPGGTMLAVRLPESEVKPLLTDAISLAAVNAPSLCVLSGTHEAIGKLQSKLEKRTVACTPLQTSHAFHSAMMAPILQPFTELVSTMTFSAPQIPFISNVTGTWISTEAATDPDYWAKHLRQTVRFADGIGELLKTPERLLLEVGPGQTLSSLAKQHPARNADSITVSSLRHAKDTASDFQVLLNTLGQLWLSGVAVDWKNFYKYEQRLRIPLPAYPFERKRYFIEPAKRSAQTISPAVEAPQFEEQNVEAVPIHHRATTATAMTESNTTAALRMLLAELSGLKPAAIGDRATFTEMGFESLFLTQFSVALKKKFGVNVAFRQLLGEFSTLEALAASIEENGKQITDDKVATMVHGRPKSSTSIPLTESQRELWFASEMSDDASCAYNECRLLHLRGELKENTLVAAIQSLVERHEALRTTFAPGGDFQRVQPVLRPDVPLLDWSKLPVNIRMSRLDALQAEEAGLPFDLTVGPLLRAWLIRLDEQHHVLVLTVHHIVCDGHSLGILLRELSEIYSAECHGAHVELAAPLQWSEYARGQSQKHAARASHETFWLNQFSGSVPALELPTDHSRSSTRTFEGAGESRLMPATLGAELKRISAQHSGTLFTTLLAAYAVWLHKLSGQDEVVVGIPIADRAVDGGESLVGHCINFLPLRLKFEADETFQANLARVQTMFLEAHEHQGFTFGSLIQKLNLPHDASRMPLVSATFNTQRMSGELKFFGLETELVTNPRAFTHFDLGFNVTEIQGALQLDCRYNKSLFTAETIQRWLGHFQTLLENIAANPQRKISELPLLSAKQQQTLLTKWNGARASYPGARSLHELFEEQVVRTPAAVAVTFGDQRVTYAELNRRANRLAHR
ncbi:MAG TPA: condensation domain-containing protein, partial [Verrucomicrobiae bacterium]|nr:condensation domain-containing protein [Verrucomicrobiae bacterium]